jgi:hypothetical protein
MSRSAAPIVKGYLYQFQNSAIEILSLPHELDTATFEDSQDLDLHTASGTIAIQYKHNPASFIDAARIRQTILDMLLDFSQSRIRKKYKFVVYAPVYAEISLRTVKDIRKLAKYKSKGIECDFIKEHAISGETLRHFVKALTFEIGSSFEESNDQLVAKLSEVFECSIEDARRYFYPAAIELCFRLAARLTPKDRTISKKAFCEEVSRATR